MDAVAEKWDYSGHFVLMKNDQILHNEHYGFENRKKEVKTTKDTRYLVDIPVDFQVDGVFSATADDLLKLVMALKNKDFLSKTIWKKALSYDEEGNGMLFGKADGYDAGSMDFLGFGCHLYFDFDKDVSFVNIVNEDQTFEMVDNSWRYFRRDSRETVASLLTFPENTKMVKVNKKNFWNALNLSIFEDQREFVLDAKSSVAMSLLYKTKTAFVQMEGDVAVGLLVLDVDKKKDVFHIDIIIIDKQFQNKGYGKLMVKWAVDYLREAGADKLAIGVARENIDAKKVYLNAGFEPKSVYDGGMELEMKL